MQAITLRVVLRAVFGMHDGPELARLGTALRRAPERPRPARRADDAPRPRARDDRGGARGAPGGPGGPGRDPADPRAAEIAGRWLRAGSSSCRRAAAPWSRHRAQRLAAELR